MFVSCQNVLHFYQNEQSSYIHVFIEAAYAHQSCWLQKTMPSESHNYYSESLNDYLDTTFLFIQRYAGTNS